MAVGDHIQADCGGYWHHGIDVGGGLVASNSVDGVMLEPLARFEGPTCRVQKVVYKQGKVCFSPQDVAKRALSRLGERQYNLVTWCGCCVLEGGEEGGEEGVLWLCAAARA